MMSAWLKQISLVVSNGLRTVVLGLGNLAIAWLIIRQGTATRWGDFVPYLVGMSVITMLLSWGNRELLLRQFSTEKTNIGSLYYQSIITRFLLLFPAALVGLLLLGATPTTAYLLLWILTFFLYQSHDAWLTYRKGFAIGVLAEIVGLGFILLALYYRPVLGSVTGLLQLYALSFGLRWLIIVVFLKPPAWPKTTLSRLVDLSFFTKAFPFLLIGLVGFLSSKTDLYVVSYSLEPALSGTYQVLTGGLNFIRATAGIIVYTFIADAYQLDKAGFNFHMRRLWILALPVCVAGVGLLSLVLTYGFHFQLAWHIYAVAIGYCLPVFVIILCVVYLYQQRQERLVIRYGLIVITVNLVLSLALLPVLQLMGGLIAGTISSLVGAGLYLNAFRRL